jgi:heme/copper-type cytochrome/quinol oxidase subunit 2
MTDPYGQQPAQRPQDYQAQAPQGYAPPPPGYGAPQGYAPPAPGYGYAPPLPPGGEPPNHLVWAIISVFLFWPTAIVAIIKATSVGKLWAQGQAQMAQEASKAARLWSLISTIVGLAVWVLVVVLIIILAATAVTITNTVPHVTVP